MNATTTITADNLGRTLIRTIVRDLTNAKAFELCVFDGHAIEVYAYDRGASTFLGHWCEIGAKLGILRPFVAELMRAERYGVAVVA